MDNAGNTQNPQPTQPNVPSPASQPVVQPVLESTQPPPASKITLEDLYGPSQPVQEVPSSSPVASQPPVPQAPVVAPNPIVQSPVQAPSAPPSGPAVSSAPQETQPIPDLPLRKQSIAMNPEPQTKALIDQSPVPLSSQPQPKADRPLNEKDKKPPSGLNKLVLFRILFGGIGVLFLIGVLFFVVTFLSSLSHPTSSSSVSLTYWGLWEDTTTMQSIIQAFEREHPTVTVTYEKEDPKEYSQRLLSRIQQGNGPDIFTYHSSWLPMVQSALVPLPTSVISKDELQNNFYPVVRNDLVKNGALYGIPLEVDTLSLFVNNTLFHNGKASVPTTWDSFGSTARSLTQKDGSGKITVAGAAMGAFDNITHAPDIMSALFMQNGVDVFTLSPTSNASDALKFYTSFATGDSKVWDNTLDPSQLAFGKGNLAMYFGYSWDIFAIKAINPNLDFSVYSIPHLPGRNTTTASYWVEGVSSKSLHQKEAFLFMQFLAQKNTAATLYAEEAKTRLFGEPYARSDLGATLKNNLLVYPFVVQARDARSSFFAGETQDTGLNSQMNAYLGNAVRSVLNNTSADTAIDTLLQGVTQVAHQYGSG